MTRTTRSNTTGSETGESLPRYFGKAGIAEADPTKTKKDGAAGGGASTTGGHGASTAAGGHGGCGTSHGILSPSEAMLVVRSPEFA